MTLESFQLACTRGDRVLFRALDFELGAGEAIRVAGANGSGKTSLLRLLCGLASPAEGEVRWDGRSIQGQREDFGRALIYCGHASGVKEDLTAWENVAISAKLAGRDCSREDACRALGQLGLLDVAHLPAGALSQGQRRRVGLARLAQLDSAPTPRLLILDEPFTALDAASVATLSQLLAQHLAQGAMVVYTTHQDITLQAARLHRLDLGHAPC
jgi:heme exporter protein A